MRNKRGFAHPEIILVILAIAVVGAVVFIFSKNSSTPLITQTEVTPDPIMYKYDMGDWISYSNKNWKFKMPIDWIAVDCGDPNIVFLGPKLREGQEIQCGTEYAHPNAIVYIAKQSRKSLPELPYSSDASDSIDVQRENIKIGNASGVKQTLVVSYGNRKETMSIDWYVEHTDSIDTLKLFDEKYQTTFDQILSTFEFVNTGYSDGGISPENEWLTYDAGNFSFKYPKELGTLNRQTDVRTIKTTNTATAHQSQFDINTKEYSGTIQFIVSEEYSEPVTTTLSDWVSANLLEGKDGSGLTMTHKQVELNNLKVGFVNMGTPAGSEVPEINTLYFEINNKVYSVELYMPFDLSFHENYSDLFDDIVSTLQFN